MRLALIIAGLAGAAMPASPALATDTDDVIALLAEMGHEVVEEAQSDGPNLVVDGRHWAISLACTERRDCEFAWLYAPREVALPVRTECANDWNGQETFTTAWIDNLNQPWLTAAIDFVGDLGPAAIRGQIERFEAQLPKFEAYIQTCVPIRKDDL